MLPVGNYSAFTKLKLPTSLEKKFPNGDLQEYTETWFPSASRMQLLGGLEVVQCKFFFLTLTRNMFVAVLR